MFGSVGTAQADQERMREIEREVGLDRMLGTGTHSDERIFDEKLKADVEEEKATA